MTPEMVQKWHQDTLNPFTGEFMMTVSDIICLFFNFFRYKIYSETGL